MSPRGRPCPERAALAPRRGRRHFSSGPHRSTEQPAWQSERLAAGFPPATDGTDSRVASKAAVAVCFRSLQGPRVPQPRLVSALDQCTLGPTEPPPAPRARTIVQHGAVTNLVDRSKAAHRVAAGARRAVGERDGGWTAEQALQQVTRSCQPMPNQATLRIVATLNRPVCITGR